MEATLFVPLTTHFLRPSEEDEDEAGDPEDLDLPSSSMLMAVLDPIFSIRS